MPPGRMGRFFGVRPVSRSALGFGNLPHQAPDGAGPHSYPTPPGAGAQPPIRPRPEAPPTSDPARRFPPPSTPRDGKWLEWGRRPAGIPCICHLSARGRRRGSWAQALARRPRHAAPARSPTTRAPQPSTPRDGKWLEWGRRGAGIPCICHLSSRESAGRVARRESAGRAARRRHRSPPQQGAGAQVADRAPAASTAMSTTPAATRYHTKETRLFVATNLSSQAIDA